MTITARVVADSVSGDDIRLTTLQLRYPKFIHNEFMTHRVFSRNASSSRSIPVERLIRDVLDDPATPLHWGANRPGMQATETCDAPVEIAIRQWTPSPSGEADRAAWNDLPYDVPRCFEREEAWLDARDRAVAAARGFAQAGYHKQIVNRLLEPFCHINVVVTATEWSNFFALRRHEGAQPEIRILAEAMWRAMHSDEFGSTPVELKHGEWHLPYVQDVERINLRFDHVSIEERKSTYVKLSVARCARVSYLTQDGRKPSVEEDLALYERLVGATPLHASPCEHQATPDTGGSYGDRWEWQQLHLHGNLRGWIQYRKTLAGECS